MDELDPTRPATWSPTATDTGLDPALVALDPPVPAAARSGTVPAPVPPAPQRPTPRQWRRWTGIGGLILVVLVTLGATMGGGPGRYPVAWVAAGALFIVPAVVLTALARRRTTGIDRVFWSWWLAGLLVAAGFGVTVLVQQLSGLPLTPLGFSLLGLSGVLWVTGIWHLVRVSGGSRIVAIDALEVLIADLVVVAPVLVVAWPALAHAKAMWWAVPAAGAAATMPVVAALSVMLCVRLPARQRRPELIGVAATVLGEANALAQVAQGATGFHLPPAPLVGCQAAAMWLVLVLVANGHRSYPLGLARFTPDAQVRRWSVLPLLVVVAVPTLVVEAVTAHRGQPWVLPVTVGALGAAVVLMTFRHVLVVNETRRLYGRLAAEAERRHALLDELVHAVDDDRHRVLAQLHELAMEWMAAIGALLRTCRGPAGVDPEVMAGVLGRIYTDVGARAEVLRRLMHAMQPPALSTAGLQSSVAAATASIFGRTGAPEVEVQMDDDIQLDWMTSTIVYRIVLEALRGALSRMPLTWVRVAVEAGPGVSELVVVVEDDARSHDLLASSDRGGLSALQLFADLGRGTVRVEPRPGGGARVVATLGARR